MIRIRNLSVKPGTGQDGLKSKAAGAIGLRAEDIDRMILRRRSVDARKKSDIRVIYTVDVSVRGEAEILEKYGGADVCAALDEEYSVPMPDNRTGKRPIIAGFGPAGMFAALVLAEAGLRPVVIERGDDVDTRAEKVSRFWRTGELDAESNVQFGEGGAGTFSDGKLGTGVKNRRIGWILRQFVNSGASEDILYDAKPHIGTDVLAGAVKSIRRRVIQLGGEVRFGTRLTGVVTCDGCLTAVRVHTADGEETIACDDLILAIGHSARDTVAELFAEGIEMEPKAFAMGVRIEHRQESVDIAQYGAPSGTLSLSPADYKQVCHLPDGRGVYTFCMCPGGYVVAASSEHGGVVTNGMSNSARDGENANAAFLVGLQPEDFPYGGALGGMRWQREIEKAAYDYGGGNYLAPAQRMEDFLNRRPSRAPGRVSPSYVPGVVWGEMDDVLPDVITGAIRAAIPELARRFSAMYDPDAVLTAPETRSSSPVRIVRGRDMQSRSVSGLYPCGEGAGYSGGIVSSAIDGMLCAEAIIAKCR